MPTLFTPTNQRLTFAPYSILYSTTEKRGHSSSRAVILAVDYRLKVCCKCNKRQRCKRKVSLRRRTDYSTPKSFVIS
jgi:hypothetical protein